MKIQLDLFLSRFPFSKLKKGVECENCGHTFKATGYELDKSITDLGFRVLEYCIVHETKEWDWHNVFANDINGSKQFYKLQFFGIIESTKRASIYRLTKIGYLFLNRQAQLPAKMWIHDWRRWHRPVVVDDRLTWVDQVDPNWKYLISHYANDYVLYPHEAHGQTAFVV